VSSPSSNGFSTSAMPRSERRGANHPSCCSDKMEIIPHRKTILIGACDATGTTFSSLLIRRAIVPSCRWRNGAEQERLLHLASITRLPLLCASKRLQCDQIRKAPRTGEGSDFVRLLWITRDFASLALTFVEFSFSLHLVTNRVNARN
jgi:hypothetical protein